LTADLRAWAINDWAVSSFQTTIQIAALPDLLQWPAALSSRAASSQRQHDCVHHVASPPVLGAISDVAAAKKRMLAIFMLIGVVAVGGMYFIERGDYVLASWLYIIATVGATASVVFYEALLPHLPP
jgi:UMF1 family MFS transporter